MLTHIWPYPDSTRSLAFLGFFSLKSFRIGLVHFTNQLISTVILPSFCNSNSTLCNTKEKK